MGPFVIRTGFISAHPSVGLAAFLVEEGEFVECREMLVAFLTHCRYLFDCEMLIGVPLEGAMSCIDEGRVVTQTS